MSHTVQVNAVALFIVGASLSGLPPCAEAQDSEAPRDIQVGSLPWQPAIDQVSPDQLPARKTRLDGPPTEVPALARPAYRTKLDNDIATFEVEGDLPFQRTMIWSANLEPPTLPQSTGYYCLRYRAQGIERSHSPVPILKVTGKDSGGKPQSHPLLTVDQVLNDNRWHTVVGKRTFDFAIDSLEVRLSTSDSLGWLEIGSLAFHASSPNTMADLYGLPPLKIDAGNSFTSIDLTSQCNDSCATLFKRLLDKHGLLVDDGIPDTSAKAIPFKIAEGEHNLIRPSDNPNRNAAQVELLGTKTTRHFFKPHGRDDLITVPIHRQASEVFFIMAVDLPPSSSCYARPSWPRPIDDIESVAVELEYAGGEHDFAFPYSLADRGFLVRRTMAAYVVPVDPNRKLAKFVLHNRLPGTNFSLAALTVNTSTTRLASHLLANEPPVPFPETSQPPARPAMVRQDGDRIVLSNAFYELIVDCGQGLSIEAFTNRWTDTEFRLHPSSGLEVECDKTVLTGRAFTTEAVQVEGNSLKIRLKSLVPEIPLVLNVGLAVDDTPQMTMNLSAENTSESTLEPTVRFPVLRDMTIGQRDNTWLFFPQYRNVITNRPGAYLAPNDCRFPMQVCDIYNPGAGAGLAVITHNLDHSSLDYSMAKTDHGVSCFIQAPGQFYPIASSDSVAFTESALVFHRGDWHEAIEAYRKWLDAVSESSAAQKTEWFRRTFLLRNHQTKKFYAWSAPIYNADTRSYCIDDCVEVDTNYLGMKPQVVHLFGWIDLENSWHGHPNGDFLLDSCTGGLETLRNAVHSLQDKHGIPTSLYTLSDRCYKNSEFGKQQGEHLAIQRKDGSLVQDEANWYLCGNTQAWRDQYVQSLCRTQRETGVKLLYVDVFPFSRSSTCYSPDHGHEVPSHVNRGSYAMIRQLRESLPDDVILWSEYPLPDMALPYIDGNIHYYCLDWHEHFGNLYNQPEEAQPFAAAPSNIYRYVFPNLKQLIFPCGISPYSGDSKFPFFNGEALYDCSWSLYASPHLDRIKKSLAIQRRYADCFASPNPTPEVPTLQPQVHANAFPGDNRTAWTLFNARYTTARGPVLAVDHHEGATYFDAWNNLPLEPEIVNGEAIFNQTLHPQQLGCIIQTTTNSLNAQPKASAPGSLSVKP